VIARVDICTPEEQAAVAIDAREARPWTHPHLDVHLRPLSRAEGPVADAVLEALGKRPADREIPRGLARRWQRIHAWVIGERIEAIAIRGAENLTLASCRQLLVLSELCRVDLYLIAPPAATRRARWPRLVRDWDACHLTVEEFLPGWPQPEPEEAELSRPFPPPPDDDFARFLNEAARDHPDPAFQRVRAVFVAARDSATDWGGHHRRFDAAALGSWLRTVVSSAATHHEALCMVRGVEAGLFLSSAERGIQLDPVRFARQAKWARQEDLVQGGGARLRWYTNTDWAMAGLARVISHCAVQDLVNLRMRDLAHDGTSVTIAGVPCRVPPIGEGIARAHLTDRAFYAPDPDDALLISEQTKEGRAPAGIKAISRWLNDITDFGDLVVADRWTPRKPLENERWLHTMGIRVFDY
jgi:hypothetical protein